MTNRVQPPFFRQKTTYTCGPACLRMIFAMHDMQVSEDDIALKTGTNERTGTARAALLKAARMHGFTCHMSSRATWQDVQDSLSQGMPVLINYREPTHDHGHYALIIGIDRNSALLHDPWNGEEFRVSVTELKKRWLGYRTREPGIGWMMTVTQPASAKKKTVAAVR